MCLMAWAIGQSTEHPLWVAANRDEQWDRPTLALDVWHSSDGTTILGGRDGLAGGSWLAFGEQGRVAMLTNVRAWPPEAAAARSRGELVTRWLLRQAPTTWQEMARHHAAHDYNGCNLVLGDVRRGCWAWLTNRDPTPHRAATMPVVRVGGWWGGELPPGVYGLSNAALDTPWPKVVALRDALTQALAAPDADSATDRLLQALQRHVPHDDERAHLESSPYVYLAQRRYGTRSSLIARWSADGSLHVGEWIYAPQQGPTAATAATPRWGRLPNWGGQPCVNDQPAGLATTQATSASRSIASNGAGGARSV
ncbi:MULTISPECIES: NRDE family protein [unclassified Tepidimonas]|uniref:NRDE family protein n=1 Tax=unclassified Tepidimonas TaxID=2631705 RepID=UPI003C7D43DD